MMEEILRCPSCGFQIRGHPTQYFTRRTVPCPICRSVARLTEEDRLRLKRLTTEGAARRSDSPPLGSGSPRLGRSHSGALRRQGGLIGVRRAQPGAFSPSSRRHPRYPARLPAWWGAQRGAQGFPAETVNVSSAGLLLVLDEPLPPGSGIQVRVETPFGSVEGEGCIAWIQREIPQEKAGIALTQLRSLGDRLRWERLIGPEELKGKTRNRSEGGVLLLLPRGLPRGSQLAVELDTQVGPAARSGRVVWVGKSEPASPEGTVVPHGIAFGQPLARAFVEGVRTGRRPPDAQPPAEVEVDAETVLSGRGVNLNSSGVFIRPAEPRRILVLDDNPADRVRVLERLPNGRTVAGAGAAGLDLLHILLLDARSFESARRLRQAHRAPTVPISTLAFLPREQVTGPSPPRGKRRGCGLGR